MVCRFGSPVDIMAPQRTHAVPPRPEAIWVPLDPFCSPLAFSSFILFVLLLKLVPSIFGCIIMALSCVILWLLQRTFLLFYS